jgi:hypothetical protein
VQRLEYLSQNLHENLELLKDYERRRRLSKEPREQRDLDDQITDVKKLLERDRQEKKELEIELQGQGVIAGIKSPEIQPKVENTSGNNMQSVNSSLDLHEDLREIKDKLDNGFDEIKRKQDNIHQIVSSTRNQELC